MKERKLLTEQSYIYIGRDGRVEPQSEEILTEHNVTIVINDRPAGMVTCIPEHLEALVLGRLLTEGIIGSMADVTALQISEDADRIQVEVSGGSAEVTGQMLLQGNHTGNDGYRVPGEMAPVVPIAWKQEWIFALADHFAAGTPLHNITWATHSCILAKDGEILFTCEDISRHNALDKVIGYALRNGIPLPRCTVYSSGRIPTDMAAKAIRAGIPILVSKASPTASAIALAKRCRLTLICAARKDRMKLFSGSFPEA